MNLARAMCAAGDPCPTTFGLGGDGGDEGVIALEEAALAGIGPVGARISQQGRGNRCAESGLFRINGGGGRGKNETAWAGDGNDIAGEGDVEIVGKRLDGQPLSGARQAELKIGARLGQALGGATGGDGGETVADGGSWIQKLRLRRKGRPGGWAAPRHRRVRPLRARKPGD